MDQRILKASKLSSSMVWNLYAILSFLIMKLMSQLNSGNFRANRNSCFTTARSFCILHLYIVATTTFKERFLPLMTNCLSSSLKCLSSKEYRNVEFLFLIIWSLRFKNSSKLDVMHNSVVILKL